MTDKEILDKAIKQASDNSGIAWGYTIGELVDNLVDLQEFAKDLWGESREQIKIVDGTKYLLIYNGWEHHLQNMVIADDPIKYLGENI